MAIFSLVVSPWASTTMTGVSVRISATALRLQLQGDLDDYFNGRVIEVELDPDLILHGIKAEAPVLGTEQAIAGYLLTLGSSTAIATVLMTGIERTVTVATDVNLTGLFGENARRPEGYYLLPAARMMELMIRDARQKVAGKG